MATIRHPVHAQPFPHTGPSSRSSYPTFIPFLDTARLHLGWAIRGIQDAIRWDIFVAVYLQDAELRANVHKSVILNTISLASIYIFDWLILPLVHGKEQWLSRNVGWFYQVLWLLPLMGLSAYLNISWSSIVAKRAYVLQNGTRGSVSQPITYSGLLNAIATRAYRAVMMTTSVVISCSMGYVPYAGPFLSFCFFCWIDAYYFFEFLFMERGMSLSRRVRHVEERWAYYLGFGLPATILCTISGTALLNATIFTLIFPTFIVNAVHARPVPADPYNPLPPVYSSRSEENDMVRHPSPFLPIRLPIFAMVLWLNDWIVRILSVGGGSSPVPRPTKTRRTLSDAADGVEDGGEPSNPYRQRVKLSRRKAD